MLILIMNIQILKSKKIILKPWNWHQIDVELEQQTSIERAYPLEYVAFYALRINVNKNDKCYDILLSKYIEKLMCLLLINIRWILYKF